MYLVLFNVILNHALHQLSIILYTDFEAYILIYESVFMNQTISVK